MLSSVAVSVVVVLLLLVLVRVVVLVFVLVFACGPKTGPAFLRFLCVVIFFGWGGVGGCNNVLSLRYHRSSSVNTLHATLYTSVVLR